MLLHAGVADRRSWREVAERLADGGARVVAYDRRGFGETSAPREPHSHVEDLARVLDEAGGEADEPVWLVGNSQGGRVAIDFALSRPDRVAALVLVAPAISGAPEPDLEELDPRERELVERLIAADDTGDTETVNRLEAWLWLDGPLEPEGRVIGGPRALLLDMNALALTAPDPGPEDEPPSAMERLGELRMPTLLVWGDLDAGPIRDGCALLAGVLPAVEPWLVEGTAHLPQLERPEEFAARVGAFVLGR